MKNHTTLIREFNYLNIEELTICDKDGAEGRRSLIKEALIIHLDTSTSTGKKA